jgi:hypothetical protein
MGKPKNVDELIAYLYKNPRVRYTNIVEGIYKQLRVFAGMSLDRERILWNTYNLDVASAGTKSTPIYCPVANGTLAFDDDSFSFTAFGVTGRFYYED